MFDADHFNTTFTNFSDQMFVKDKRDEAFLKIKSGSKKHLFLKDLMWGKAARAKQAAENLQSKANYGPEI